MTGRKKRTQAGKTAASGLAGKAKGAKPGATSKPAARTGRGEASRSAPSQRAGAAGRTESTLSRAATDLQEALSDARRIIDSLTEDRDNQVALAEAAELERVILEKKLDEALRRIQALEGPGGRASEPAAPPAEVPLPFDDGEEEEEEEESASGEAEDDVESIYTRMTDPRVRRQELDRERLDRESESGDQTFWMICPKCGDHLEEVDAENVKIERCEGCGGIYIDAGEVEMLLRLGRGPEGLHRIRDVLET